MKTWMWLTPLLVILLGIVSWIGWMFMDSISGGEKGTTMKASTVVNEQKDGEDGEPQEVVNTPLPDSVVVFKSDDVPFENGHDFIGQFHDFYNNTLGWGRYSTADYDRQVEKAQLIIKVIENAEVKDKDMRKDFKSILELAETVVSKDDRNAMLKLHRYFHDLDIYFNGYSYDQTFKITEFRG